MLSVRRKSGCHNLRGIGSPMVSVKEESGSMLLYRRTPVIATAAIVLSMLVPIALHAAGTSPGKVSVPSRILLGSSVTKGRSFNRPTMREDTLGGIRLGREAREVLSKWGNPTRIVVGGGGGEEAAPGAPGGPAYTPAGGNPYASLTAGVNMAAGMLGLQNSPGGPMAGGLPPLPGYPAPNTSPLPNAGPASGGAANLSEDEFTWTYDLQGGITLEFVVTDGLVTQITVGGTGPWGMSKTRTGLQLGDTYKLVWWVCGNPESQRFVNGKYLRVSYVNANRVVYTLLKNRVVGVTIALVPQDIT